MRLARFLAALLLPLFVHCLASPAPPPVVVAGAEWPYELNREISILEDPTGRYTRAELLNKPELFTPLDGRQPSFGITESTWWMRFTVDNRSGLEKRLVYSIRNPLLDKVDITLRHPDGEIEFFQLGDLPIQPKLIAHSLDPALPFDLRAQDQIEFLVRVQTSNFMTLSMWLADEHTYYEVIRQRSMWHGGLIALFIGLFAFNFLLIRNLRQPVFYWYVAFLPLSWLTIATEYGFAGTYLFEDSTWLRNQGMVLLSGLMYVAATGFAYAFLDLRKSKARRHMLGGLMLLALSLCLSTLFLSLHASFLILSFCIGIFPLGLAAISTYALLDGDPRARYLLLSQASAWGTQLVFGAWVLGWLPYHWLFRNALSIGLAVNAILMALALADWIKRIQSEKERAQASERMILLQHQQALEREVALRTCELERARQIALEQAMHDPLTGAHNRRATQEDSNRAFAQARRMKEPLSVAMIDIDHFKRVNDEGGHAEGDRILVALVQCLGKAIRAGDLLGRWGGEEFLLVMPHTDANGARIVAERCRMSIEAALRTGTPQRPVTASFGVATLGSKDASVDHLFSRADRALYMAKSNGRNCVVVIDAACEMTA